MATRALLSCGIAGLLILCGSRVLQNAVAEGDTRTITLHHIHTDEDITITFKRDGRYDETALEKLNWFLRDWRKQEQTRMDPHLIDLIWEVQRETGSQSPVWVVCGYRSPETNAMLRRKSEGVAKFSQHMLGHAMDFYIPGVPIEQLRVIGLRLQRGGVGFYPTSGSPFVHMDTGGVRYWPRMAREDLMRVFPDGRTVHIPADGRPLPGYVQALADLQRRGDKPSEMSIQAARGAGIVVADNNVAQRLVNPFAKFLGLKRDDEDDDAGGAAAATMASSPPEPAAAPLRERAKAAVAAAVDRAGDKLAADKAKLAQLALRTEEKVAAGKTKLAQVAAGAEEKLAAGKAKLGQATAKVRRVEANQVAALTPNQIIVARGYWQGLPDGVNPLATLPSRAPGAAEYETTGSTTPLGTTFSGPSEVALAYAEQGDRGTSSKSAMAPVGSDFARATVTAPAAVQAGTGESTIAVKRVNGRPASGVVIVAKKLTAALADDGPMDPWMRAIVMSPSVTRYLSITMLGLRDAQALAALMVKPSSSVMMTFGADPQPGLTQDHFSGSAIVFVSTVTYPMRTADLR